MSAKLSLRRKVDPRYWESLSQQFLPRITWQGPTFLVIDPGAGKENDPKEGTGWSAWTIDGEIEQPIVAGCIYRVLEEWQEQVFLVHHTLATLKNQLNSRYVAVEEPHFFTGNRGMWAARSGSLLKLSMLVGSILTLDPGVLRVPVSSWKGNKDKIATTVATEAELGTKEMKRLLGNNREKWNHNTCDSLGIGLWLRRNLKLLSNSTLKLDS